MASIPSLSINSQIYIDKGDTVYSDTNITLFKPVLYFLIDDNKIQIQSAGSFTYTFNGVNYSVQITDVSGNDRPIINLTGYLFSSCVVSYLGSNAHDGLNVTYTYNQDLTPGYLSYHNEETGSSWTRTNYNDCILEYSPNTAYRNGIGEFYSPYKVEISRGGFNTIKDIKYGSLSETTTLRPNITGRKAVSQLDYNYFTVYTFEKEYILNDNIFIPVNEFYEDDNITYNGNDYTKTSLISLVSPETYQGINPYNNEPFYMEIEGGNTFHLELYEKDHVALKIGNEYERTLTVNEYSITNNIFLHLKLTYTYTGYKVGDSYIWNSPTKSPRDILSRVEIGLDWILRLNITAIKNYTYNQYIKGQTDKDDGEESLVNCLLYPYYAKAYECLNKIKAVYKGSDLIFQRT